MKIKHLKLYCANLEEQRHFYTQKFKFEIEEEEEECFTLKIGDSLLTFTENRIHQPYYHFAFNIPHQCMEKALKWTKTKVDVISTKEDGEIQELTNFKARAIYFLDPAGNIVELIGRENVEATVKKSFNESQLLNVSEIGVPVFQVDSAFRSINNETGMSRFDGRSNVFIAAGDDEGLFILVDQAEKSWFPTDDAAQPHNLAVEFEEAEAAYDLSYENGTLEIAKRNT